MADLRALRPRATGTVRPNSAALRNFPASPRRVRPATAAATTVPIVVGAISEESLERLLMEAHHLLPQVQVRIGFDHLRPAGRGKEVCAWVLNVSALTSKYCRRNCSVRGREKSKLARFLARCTPNPAAQKIDKKKKKNGSKRTISIRGRRVGFVCTYSVKASVHLCSSGIDTVPVPTTDTNDDNDEGGEEM